MQWIKIDLTSYLRDQNQSKPIVMGPKSIEPTSNLRTKVPTPNFRDQSQIFKIGVPRSFIFFFNLACILFVLFLFGLGLGYFVSPSIDYISLFEFCFLSHLVNLTSLLRLIFRALQAQNAFCEKKINKKKTKKKKTMIYESFSRAKNWRM